jgi:Mg2+ and Co2+ transporter CorA
MDRVVVDYGPVVEGLQNDIDEIEAEVFGDTTPRVSRRVYELSREVLQFHKATQPLAGALEGWTGTTRVGSSTRSSAGPCATSGTTCSGRPSR